MNRWLWMASIVCLLAGTTGCLHSRTGNMWADQCNSCNSYGPARGWAGKTCGCGRTGCVPGPIGWQQGGLNYSSHLCPHGGTAGHCSPFFLGRRYGTGMPEGEHVVRPGLLGHGPMMPGAMGQGMGGHGMGGHGMLGHGMVGHGALAGAMMPGHHAANQLQNQPFNPGPPTGTVTYPYYTHRGPRDFLLDNPPSIGR